MKWRQLLVVCSLLVVGAVLVYLTWEDRLERSQDVPIREAARRYGVEPALVKAVVWRESRFNPRARGTREEIGLMQLQEYAAREWAETEHIDGFEHEHCLDPRTNTLAGAWYLRKWLKRYARTDNPLPYALAAYNAGSGNVSKWNHGAAGTNSAAFIEQIGFPGTREYVKAVMARCEHYRARFK